MMMETSSICKIDASIFDNYMHNLVNQFFKILPIRESEEQSLCEYMRSLQRELLGCKEFVIQIKNDSMFLSLLSILQYLIDHKECTVREVRREVFKAISICNKIGAKYHDSIYAESICTEKEVPE